MVGPKNVRDSNDSSDDAMEDAANEDDSTYDSSFSSPVRLSSSVNSPTAESDIHKDDHDKDNFINDITEIEIRSREEDNSNYNSSYSSPVRLSNSEIPPTDVHKEDEEKGNFATDIKITSKEEDNSAYNSSYSSPVRSSNSQHLINAFADEPDIAKEAHSANYITINSNANEMMIREPEEEKLNNISSSSSPVRSSNSEHSINAFADEPVIVKEKGNSTNYTTLNLNANEIAIRGSEEEKLTNISSSSSPVRSSNSEPLINAFVDGPDIVEEGQEKDNYSKLNSNANEMMSRGPEEDNSTNISSSSSPVGLLNSLKSINVVSGEHNIQKEYNENGNYVNNQTLSSNINERDIKGPEDANSTALSSSSSPSSINAVFGEAVIQKIDNENGNFVNDATFSFTANDMEIVGLKEGNFTDISSSSSPVGLSNSLISINANSAEPNIQKEDSLICNSVNDETLNLMKNDIEIRGKEEGNSTNDSSSSSPLLVSTSENLINGLSRQPDAQTEAYEKGNIVNDSAEQGKIVDYVNDDTEVIEQCSEMNIVNHQSTDNIEMKSKDGDLRDQNGIIENSSFEETQTTDSNENTSNKENRLVIYGSHDPWPGNVSVLSKFLKFKSLYTVSNIFRRLSKKTDVQNDSNENNINDESSSLIGISDENSQQDKNELTEVALKSSELKAIKGRIILYTKLWCKDCKDARAFLRSKKLRYSEINIDVYPSRKAELEEITGSVLVPKVFFNQVLIGGLHELKGMDESGQLEEKIEFVTCEEPSPKAPQPPFSGEDDVSSRGIIDELAIIVRKMKESVVVKDRFYKFRRVTNCFRGSDAVDFLSEDQFLERAEAIEFGRKLAKELFFRHALEENTFEDGNHPYRFLDHDPVIGQCQNIPRGIIQLKRQPLIDLSHRLKYLLYAILDAYTSEDGRHIAYRSIHGSEEFARYLRIAEELQRLDLNRTSKEERLAFFINLYNMMAIHAILVWSYPEGALERRKLLNDFKYVIGGSAYSLSDIYNGILRSNQRPPYTLIKPFGITDKRFKVSLPYPEPLIHFALVLGNRSAPALRCYCPRNIDRELMDAARDFLESGAFVLDLDSLTISVTKILKWYSVDFGRNEVEVLKHAANYLDIEKTQTLLELLNNTQLKVVYQPYDWSLNS